MIRNGDNPTTKDAVMAELKGEIVGHLRSIGLKDEDEFAVRTKDIFQCSVRVIYIDKVHSTKQVVVVLKSTTMDVEYGLSYKETPPEGQEKVIKRRGLDNMRYKISSGTEPELIDKNRQEFNELFDEIKTEINNLINDK